MRNNLKNIRMSEYLMSSTEFAKMLGVSITTYSNWETGVSKPGLDKALEISKKLNRTIEEIWYLE